MERPIPELWMPDATMRRVILHWTGGAHAASALDREHYHVLIEADGRLVRGRYTIADNQSTADGRYAAHTLNLNQGSIAVSLCGMLGAVQAPYRGGRYEINRTQWEAAARAVAQLCARYGVPVTPQTVLQHGEVQAILGVAQRQKWDVCLLPWAPERPAAAVGEEFRELVRKATIGR